jgi:2-oxoacid dehydrogenases acyltransferase (catalytic domain)
MPLFSRHDGTLATDIAPYRRIMPFIMKSRNESAVYFEQEMDLTKTLGFIEAWNAANPERRITPFHVFLWAATQCLHQRPGMNRFVAGGNIYQRNGIWISYSAKKELKDGSPIVLLKRQFDPTMSFSELVSFVYGDLKEGRSEKKLHQEKEINLSLKLPSFLLAIGIWFIRLFDGWNLLPAAFIKPDPMYASMFIANLGSVKLDSAYHHLYEYGNIPVFATIGRNKKVACVGDDGQVAVKTVCSVKYSFDERTEDGLYCAKTLDMLRTYLEDPEGKGASAKSSAAAA